MKKWTILFLSMLVSLMLVTGASAEYTFNKVSEGTGIRFIEDSNFLRKRTDGGVLIVGIDGTPLSDVIFEDVEYDEGCLIVQKLDSVAGDHGVLRADGLMLSEPIYWNVQVENQYWVVAEILDTVKGKGFVKTYDVYSMKKGARVATLSEEECYMAFAANDVLNIENRAKEIILSYDQDFNILGKVSYVTDYKYASPSCEVDDYRDNGLYGLKDTNGNIVMEPKFDRIYAFFGDYAIVEKGGHQGLVDKQGRVAVPAQYDDIVLLDSAPYTDKDEEFRHDAAGYAAAIQDGKVCFVNLQDGTVFETGFAEDDVELFGASLTYTDGEGKLHLLAADGVDTVLEGYEEVKGLRHRHGQLYHAVMRGDKHGLIDWHGNVVLPLEYTDLSISGDGRYLQVERNYDTSEILEILEGDFVEEAPAADANIVVRTLLDAAIAKLEADAAGGKANIVELLESASVMLGDTNTAASAMIGSTLPLIEADAAANAQAVITILETVKPLL